MRKLVIILGVPVDDLAMDEALARLEEFIAVGRATGKSHQVATINADFVVNARHDPELRRILQESDMATADGMPLVWGARLLGVPMTDRVTGADLVPALTERAARAGYSIYLLGGKPGVADRAARVLQERYPGLTIAGSASPQIHSVLEVDQAILEDVRAARPDILLVAFGNPKQEKWISMYARDLAVPLSIGIGGALDFIAGYTKRAPLWMQRTGLEWLYRLLQEPRRLWKRYIHDLIYFGSFFAWQLWIMRHPRSPSILLPAAEVAVVDHTVVINVQGRLDINSWAAFAQQFEQVLEVSPFIVVNLARAEFLDSAALGALVALANRTRTSGGRLWLAAVPPHIQQVLALLKLDQFFEMADNVEMALRLCLPPPPLAESEGDNAGWQVVRVPRAVDTLYATLLLDVCSRSLANNPKIILDFSETIFLSSKGLSAIIALNQLSRAKGGVLRVAGCSAEVLHTIELVKLDSVVPTFRTVRAAISA